MNDVYLIGLRVLAYSLLSIWGLWIMYVCVIRLQMLRDAGQLTTGIKIFGYPTLFVGLLPKRWASGSPRFGILRLRTKPQLCLVKKSIPTVDEALAQIPPFVMPEQQKVGE